MQPHISPTGQRWRSLRRQGTADIWLLDFRSGATKQLTRIRIRRKPVVTDEALCMAAGPVGQWTRSRDHRRVTPRVLPSAARS
jgi:hypothetical protein